jgi:RNA polymerase sigma-70 factor (ECF subfamily)
MAGGNSRATGPHEALARALEDEPGRVLSVLVRAIGDIDLAEDALQDAVTTALERWPVDGVPSNPSGWLVTAARRKAIDRLRRIAVERRKHTEIAALAVLERARDPVADEHGALGDERLTLMFACCHPALPIDHRVALTLRSVGGLNTAEIARAFLVTESTMKQRVSRAKRTIRGAHVPLSLPSDGLLEERLPSVLAVLYLIFNEGYLSSRGEDLTRVDLTHEAIRLTRLTADKLPSAETSGLLALMLFHEARAATRLATDRSLIPMDEQDRSQWDHTVIAEANGILSSAARAGNPGQYQLQAAIASVHANAARSEDTNWRHIVMLYDGLIGLAPTPVFRLNRAVACGMADGPAAGLERINALEGLDDYHLLHAARADMLRRLGRLGEAKDAYGTALGLTGNYSERRYCERRIAECHSESTAHS